jgi:ParB family chromosome partitioning protein
MAKAPQKITLSPSRDIPFDRLILSQSNVRRVKAGVSVAELAEDISRRTLLQSLSVRPALDADGKETDLFEVPAGGRRYRALELLVKQKRLAKTALVPCIVKPADADVTAEEDSYAENTHREPLHPLDQFRAMRVMVEAGQDIETIAARFMTTPAVVRQRLKLASVSPTLHEIYAEDGMTLEQLMAFSVADDHARQEQVWELLAHSYNKSAAYIRQKLTEDTVRVADRRVRFVTIDAYVSAGGGVMRDLFEPDDGGWLTDPALLDRLVEEKLATEGERIAAEGWKWVATAVDLPWNANAGMREIDGTPVAPTADEEAKLAALQAEADDLEEKWANADCLPEEVNDRLEAIDEEIGALVDRPHLFDPADMARAGAFVSIEVDGSLLIERGYVRPEDEPAADEADGQAGDETDPATADRRSGSDGSSPDPSGGTATGGSAGDDDDADEDMVKPLPDKLVSELTVWRTMALQDAIAQSPATAFAAVLHAIVLDTFYLASRESCLEISLRKVDFSFPPAGLKDSAPAGAIAERHAKWKARLPKSDKDLWDALLTLDGTEQASLFAHCASQSVNAQYEVAPKYDNGRISAHTVERRLSHSHVLARAIGLDMVGAGWRPTVDNYFRSVTKSRILADVADAKGPRFAEMIDHLKKGDMAHEAERLMEDAHWLPEPLRTPGLPDLLAPDNDGGPLPAFLGDDEPVDADNGEEGYAVAAE